jgi:hypothetical protein
MKNFIYITLFLAMSSLGGQCQQSCIGTTGPCEWREGQQQIAQASAPKEEEEPITPGAARQQLLLSLAIHDWKAHEHLPFLPRLDRPIHIKQGSVICNTGGELLNPNKPVLFRLQECIVLPVPLPVQVLEPTEEEEYVTDHMTGAIQIIYRSKDVSDGHVYGGWVFIKSLSN